MAKTVILVQKLSFFGNQVQIERFMRLELNGSKFELQTTLVYGYLSNKTTKTGTSGKLEGSEIKKQKVQLAERFQRFKTLVFLSYLF